MCISMYMYIYIYDYVYRRCAAPCKEGGFGFDYRLAMAIPDMFIKLLKECIYIYIYICTYYNFMYIYIYIIDYMLYTYDNVLLGVHRRRVGHGVHRAHPHEPPLQGL